jgi:ferredoxin-NADP reductase
LTEALTIPGLKYESLTIDFIREEAHNFKTFTFKNGHAVEYQSGQFITLVDHSGKHEIRRSYSIISSPALNEPLAIAVKRIDNGFFSRKLVDHTRTGDQVFTTGAAGFFRLPENIRSFQHIFFFAAGSGIAPILSLIKTVLHNHHDIFIYLLYSNPSLESTAFYDVLKSLEHHHPRQLQVHFLFSSEADLRKARLNRDFLLEFLAISRFEREKTLFYTCGPENYMRMIIFLLLEEGFPSENIKKEDFNPGNKKLTPHTPPDRNTHQVTIELEDSSVHFPVQYPDSILQAAKKIKLNLPYSCETGKCGSCAALCKSGKVWLSNNEVLTEKDLAQGLILTCTGHPQMGDVVLKIGR